MFINRIQRANYQKHKILALEGEVWTTLVVDGMDQSKTNVPRFRVEDKKTATLPKLITHVTGTKAPMKF